MSTATHEARPQRRLDIELLRILACVGIVLFHTLDTGKALSYSGIVVFTFLSAWLTLKARPANWQDKTLRLLRPWAFWFAVYAVFNVLVHRQALGLHPNGFSMLFAGPSLHLWYMPFIWLWVLILTGIRRWVPASSLSVIGAILFAAAMWSAPAWRPHANEALAPLAQWAHATPAIFLGMACASPLRNRLTWGLLGLGLAGAGLQSGTDPWLAGPYLLGGSACMLLSLRAWPVAPQKPRLRRGIAWVAACTSGIYFTHVLTYQLILRLHWPLDPVLIPWMTIGASMVLITTLRRMAPRWVSWWS